MLTEKYIYEKSLDTARLRYRDISNQSTTTKIQVGITGKINRLNLITTKILQFYKFCFYLYF